MAPLQIPGELKKITPYVRRAEELDKDTSNPESRLVAYYCRQYAVHQGISLAVSDEGKATLGVLLQNLEGEKVAMDSFTRDEAKFLCMKFANKIFDNADLEDRTGDASKSTARVFYAAGSFLDILQQFYQDDDTSEELMETKKKIKYAKWKAAEILKAINEGRKPTPGGYGESTPEDEEEEAEEEQDASPRDPSPKAPAVETVSDDDSADEKKDSTPSIPPPMPEPEDDEGTEVELGPPPSFSDVAPPAMPPPTVHKPPLKFSPPAPTPPPAAVSKPTPPPRKDDYDDVPVRKPKKASFFGLGGGKKNKNTTGKLSKAEIADATELTTFALSALADKDADLAADRLEQALKVLGRR